MGGVRSFEAELVPVVFVGRGLTGYCADATIELPDPDKVNGI